MSFRRTRKLAPKSRIRADPAVAPASLLTTSDDDRDLPFPREVKLVFKSHLDIGYTDLAANVVQKYFDVFIPAAVRLAEETRGLSRERFIWTTGSWIIYEYLEQARTSERRRLERAIGHGDISWHALPFTTHTELVDPGLFRVGLSLARRLDRRFGRETIAAKMTDVPGHTRGIVPLLAEAGVRLLHLGVNPAAAVPSVPEVFVWRVAGAEIIVIYQRGSYGDLTIIPGVPAALAFAHADDNEGPPEAADVSRSFRAFEERVPGADVVASTLDDFARALLAANPRLPVLDSEIGDTWIHGVATDPGKIARYRELLRLRARWTADDPAAEVEIFDFDRRLLLVPEHTWGLDIRVSLGDASAWDAASFNAARRLARFRRVEASWREQREYIDRAINALPTHRRAEARASLQLLRAHKPRRSGWTESDPREAIEGEFFSLRLDPTTGSVVSLVESRNGCEWSDCREGLGALSYQTFSAADYDRFYRQYVINKRANKLWAPDDYGKPGVAVAEPESRLWRPSLRWLGRRIDEHAQRALVELELPQEAVERYGAPASAFVLVTLSLRTPVVWFDLQWFDKAATRLPEALWFTFAFGGTSPDGWRLQKLGQLVSPLEVVANGNRKLHAVLDGARYDDGKTAIELRTLDAPLVAPGERSLLDFNNRQPRSGALHFNLYNNLWGTNFPQWYDENARFRFSLAPGLSRRSSHQSDSRNASSSS